MVQYLHVRSSCGSGFTPWVTQPVVINNDAPGAMLLTLGAGCTGNPYNNTNASHALGEPYPSCNNNSLGHHTAWFRFVAPANGAVRVSTDVLPSGSFTDTKIALFSAGTVGNYATFNIISCDEDGGASASINFNSTLYATGLTSGQTYYVVVDGWSTADFGSFCLTADELSSTMIASTSLSCNGLQTPEANTTTYTGWVPLMTTTGQLVALVKNPAGGAGISYTSSLTKNTGAVRSAGGQFYLDRNYRINNSTITTPVDVQLFFLNTETTALSTAIGGAGVTLSGLNVTRQSGPTCQPTYVASNGTITFLAPSANGTANGVSGVQVQTSSFSNFFIHAGTFPLIIRLGDISAVNVAKRNRVDWNTLSEETGDWFELERSADGVNFTRLGSIKANGKPSNYSYWDENPIGGLNHYRLKMFSKSGEYSYSKNVSAFVKGDGAFVVAAYPNPVTDQLTISISGKLGKNAAIILTDVSGKVITRQAVAGSETIVNMGSLAQGMYFIKYFDDDHSQIIKITKK